jgi:hypothetical protein
MKNLRMALLMALLLASATGAHASYSFSIPKMTLDVTPQRDASVELDYTIVFACQPSGEAIGVVDVGLPTRDYDIATIKAALNGQPQTSLVPSPTETGVRVQLSSPIQPGDQGKFTFSCVIPNLVYQDTTDKNYASLRITPTWYDPQSLVGTTDLWIIVYLPADIKPDEVKWQLNQKFTDKGVSKNHTFVAWQSPEAQMNVEHLVGLSFPKRDLSRVVTQSVWTLAWKWWTGSSNARLGWGILLLIFFGTFFFKATHGTGITLYLILAAVFAFFWASSPALEALALPLLVVMWVLMGRHLGAETRDYLPAIASTPGGGIKRGLTVPEAAVLLEVPLGRVLTMVIFGMIKKGVLTQTQAQPLIVTPAAAYAGPADQRRAAAQQEGSALRDYEQEFLDVIVADPGKPVQELDFKKPMKDLITATVGKMAGFELAPTREYYKGIMNKAWANAKGLGDLSARSKFIDDNLLWMMMSPTYDDDFGYWGHQGYYYYPMWIGYGFPGGGGGGVGGAVPAAPGGGQTTLGDVGASFSGWAENLSGRLAGSVDPVSLGLAHPGLNLSGVDHVTGELLESMATSGGDGGGGCACAGCACACACAGGGE